MTDDARLLKRIHDLPIPRDFNPMPDWVDRAIFQSLLQKGYLTTFDLIPDEQGVPCIALGVEVTDTVGLKLLGALDRHDAQIVAESECGESLVRDFDFRLVQPCRCRLLRLEELADTLAIYPQALYNKCRSW